MLDDMPEGAGLRHLTFLAGNDTEPCDYGFNLRRILHFRDLLTVVRGQGCTVWRSLSLKCVATACRTGC